MLWSFPFIDSSAFRGTPDFLCASMLLAKSSGLSCISVWQISLYQFPYVPGSQIYIRINALATSIFRGGYLVV